MNRVLFLVVAILALALPSASAQYIAAVKNSIANTADGGGVVTITEDESVAAAVARVEASTATPAKAQGYRFVVYYDNQQYADERAAKVLSQFRAKFKDVTSYITSESPSFRVVVGDCFNYEEAAIVRNRIIDDSPDAAICDASIPYRVLCHIKGTNHLRIERNSQPVGGDESEVVATEEPASEAVAAEIEQADIASPQVTTEDTVAEHVAEVKEAAQTESVE